MKALFWLLAIVGAIMTLSWALRLVRIALWQLQATLGPVLLLAGIIGLLFLYLRRGRDRVVDRR